MEEAIKVYKEFLEKYPPEENFNEMSLERAKQFVEDCFVLYEKFGFYEYFQPSEVSMEYYEGEPFEVIGRVPVYDGNNDGADLECLPMWKIKFQDGTQISAFADEICVGYQWFRSVM